MTATGQDVYDLVRASRTYRRYDASRPVTREDVLGLIDTARFAPTGNNLQPVRFHMATDPETVAALAGSHGWAALLKDFDGPAAPGELPTAYLGFCVPEGQGKNPIDLIDVGILAQTVALAAAARGIGTCMIKSYRPAANDLLGLPGKGYELALLMALGYPAADEQVRLEDAGGEHGVAYWRSAGNVHHVPKLSVEALLV